MSDTPFDDGYAWAAGELLSGRMTPEKIEDQIAGNYDEFDRGAQAALRAWSELPHVPARR